MTSAETCEHAADIRDVVPNAGDHCPECVAKGDTWVHLRVCLTCGHVGCCDSSTERHADAHYRDTDHPVMRSFETGEAWKWCYVDQRIG